MLNLAIVLQKNSVAHTNVNLRSVLERKLFTMSICPFTQHTGKDAFFQRHLRVNPVRIGKSAIETRKMRISAEIDIQKNYFGCLVNNTHNNQIKRIIEFNLELWELRIFTIKHRQ